MITIREYVMAESLEQAYTLNQSRGNAIIGGMIWLKMSNKAVNKAIDLSSLGLDTITESETAFTLGAMTTLRTMETHAGLQAQFGDAIHECMRHIVGVQLRNSATVGGSIYMRFGFSDVLTLLLVLDAQVTLYKRGVLSLAEYVTLPYDRDVLVNIILPKRKLAVDYRSMRLSATDLPLLTCAVACDENGYRAAIGARPHRAVLVQDDGILQGEVTAEKIADFAQMVQNSMEFGTNERASADYRKHLCGVLVKRSVQAVAKEMETWNSN